MRRRSTTSALSPKLLKHFAAATVVLTALIAVFASGADWGAQAQIEAVEAKNQLVRTEAEKLGIKRIGNTVRIANSVRAASFGEDDRSNFGGAGEGYVSPTPRPEPDLQRRTGSPWAASTGTGMLPPPPGKQAELVKAKPVPANAPSPDEIARITASSAQRSGAAAEID